jgi:ATP-binding cassette subfamily C (CFTR/MRP) protein 4
MNLVAHYVGIPLTAAVIASTLEVIFSFKFSIIMLGLGLGFYYEVKVVFARFASIFSIKPTAMIRIDPLTKDPINSQQGQGFEDLPSQHNILQMERVGSAATSLNRGEILFKDFNGYWKRSFDTPSLKDLNLFFRRGVFYGITGRVGAGKSALLGAVLGEIPFYSGEFAINGSVSYVEQEPVIFSETVRSNILFGKAFDPQLYGRAVEQSCLTADFEILEKGDQTMVGEKGITLSGGQKARLTLARAIYADSDIFVLDDPISAVDAKVAWEIHEKCLKQLCKNKTLILVTHQIGFLYDCDQVIIMDEGRVRAAGRPSELTAELRQMSADLKKGEEVDEPTADPAKREE